MPSSKKDTVQVSCPRCGYAQPEPRGAYSTVCKNCQQHFRVQEALRPAAKTSKVVIEQRRVRCFQCGTELEAPKAAASTMCKRCSGYVDLSDYRITQTVSKNFRTHGWLVVEEKGYVLNTEAIVGEAVIKGRLIGKLTAENTLEIHSTANIKGTFTAGRLVIPPGNHFRWPEPLRLGGAEIGGELVAELHCFGTVHLRSTGRLFGDVEAANFVVEAGAVFVGTIKIGKAAQVAKPAEIGTPLEIGKPAELKRPVELKKAAEAAKSPDELMLPLDEPKTAEPKARSTRRITARAPAKPRARPRTRRVSEA
ncbi:MAG TPA: polymer-forming cytoskeletal protein [Candidatus Acidoferrum sp.]|jgi:cytoskeletal protein CcmA (bactofilin family)|nr:polymer-forming cytoskeletal protein [Candidatus Acidoferrum sp.]